MTTTKTKAKLKINVNKMRGPCLSGLLVVCGILLSACNSTSNHDSSVSYSPGSNSNSNSSSSSSSSSGFGQSLTGPYSYDRVTAQDRNWILGVWASRDLSAQSVELVYTKNTGDDEVRIYQHKINGRTHYGAITIPNSQAMSTGVPVVIFAGGLQQSNPSINIQSQVLNHSQGDSSTTDFIQIIPAFRGRALIYDGLSFSADGDFCDAYDGAADDAIAMLNVAESRVSQGRYDKVMVTGGSRGGNTALLLAVRDRRINVAMPASAPVDFHRTSVRNHYGSQYSCQFFDDKNNQESRERILASSPLHFDVLPTVENIILHHGTQDSTVPFWNLQEMAINLEDQGVNYFAHAYAGEGHRSLYDTPAYAENFDRGVQIFLENLEAAP